MRRSQNLIATKSALIIVILIALHFLKILSPIENAITYIIGPISSSLLSISSNIANTYTNYSEKKDFINSLNQLEITNNELIIENQELKYLLTENKELRQLLDFKESAQEKLILANIITKPFSSPILNSGMIIDKGAKDGLSEGLIVLDSIGMVVGKITKIDDHISEVCLLTQKKCEFAAMVQNQDMTSGLTSGELELTTKMNYIPQNKSIKLQDIVVTSGLEANIPAGLILGKIIQIFHETNDVWKSVIIEPTTNLDKISIVSIILPN